MENYKEEIAKLQNQLDELKSKIEKPQFEVGKWYVLNSDWCFLVNISKIEDNNIFGYGFNYYGTRNEYIENPENAWVDIESLDSYHLATQKEVEEALTKEAVKRRFKDGVRFKSAVEPNDKDNFIFKSPFDFKINYNNDGTRLWGASSGCIFSNGKWATPIKTKTIDELAMEFDKFCYTKDQSYLSIQDSFIAYSKENKEEIIETLNNL